MSCGTRPTMFPTQSWRHPVGYTTFGWRSAAGNQEPNARPPKSLIRIKSNEQTWLEGQKTELLGFVEFGHLADIITNSWDEFSDLIPTQHWLKQRMDELEKTRNFIAHHRVLLPSEFARIEMYVADWNRV